MSEITVIQPDTVENALNQNLKAPSLDPIVLSIANDYLAGKEILEIADMYNVEPDRVSAIIEKKEVKSYIDNVYLSQGYLNRVRRLSIINKVIENKLEEAEETGIYSKKDLLDWLKMLNEVEAAVKPKDNKPAVAVQVNNNYQKLMEDLKS